MENSDKGISPAWKNPRERLKKHLKRGNSSRSLIGPFDATGQNTGCDVFNVDGLPKDRSSRSNPFKRSSPVKKRRKEVHKERASCDVSITWDDSNANDPFSNESFIQRGHVLNRSLSRSFAASSDHSLKESFATDFSDIFCGEPSASTVETDTCSSDVLPTDLRLGTKLKIVTRRPFPWMRDATASGAVPVRITGQQRHEGLRTFLELVARDFNSLSVDNIPSDVSPMALLESACLYWQFPCLPWLSVYPRIDALVNAVTSASQSMPTLPTPCLEALDIQWTECFDQLFLSWKRGDRRSFYMSCSSFTVLFTKASFDDAVAPVDDSMSCFQTFGGLRHVAIITPSTIGFRQYLKNEGIVFEVIRRKSRLNAKLSTPCRLSVEGDSRSNFDWQGITQSQPPIFSSDSPQGDQNKENVSSKDESDESPGKGDLSGDHEWLEDIGMSPRNTAKLKRYKSLGSSTNLSSDLTQSKTDIEEVVAVLVKGADVQTLYNLLQSSRVCRSIAGPHANLPPTLSASQPFLFAQMQTLRRSSQVIRKTKLEYVLELDGGPIMPHAIPLVAEFVRRTGLCADEPAVIRTTDRSVCNGINELDPDLCDWTELRVEKEKFCWDRV